MKRLYSFILIIMVLSLMFIPNSANASDKLVYVVPVQGAIDGALPRVLNRAINEAEMSGADIIILEINSPGGYVNEAGEIKDIILASKVPIYAFVNNDAFSAAAFLALACDRIYMTPTGTMGDAEVITGDGERASEKIISAWDGQMRTLAEANGRDPEIASAMVRREIEIEGLVGAGQLLTLTSLQASQYGYSEGTYRALEELLTDLTYGDATVYTFSQAWAERLARFVTNPQIASLLLAVGMAALVLEIFTAGFGVAGIVSISAFVLFFGGHIIAGFANWEYIIIFLLGIGLLIAEIFVAGFGLLGAGGITLVFVSVIFTARTFSEGVMMLGLASLFTILLLFAFWKVLSKTKVWDRLVLKQKENVEEGYVASAKYEDLLNKDGIAITPLRPAGTAEIEGRRYDVVTEGGYISSGDKINVIKVGSNNIVVKKID